MHILNLFVVACLSIDSVVPRISLCPDCLPQGPLPCTIQSFLHHSFQLDHCCVEENNAGGGGGG